MNQVEDISKIHAMLSLGTKKGRGEFSMKHKIENCD